MRDYDFDAALDAYQEREAEMAIEREIRGNLEAQRPDAKRVSCTFADLQVGDFMTNESGPHARWVEIVEHGRDGDTISVTFKTPQPIGVGMHDRWCITRPADTDVTRDGSVR